GIDVITPVLVFSHDPENPVPFFLCIIVDTCKKVEVPFEIAMLSLPARKVKISISLYIERLTDFLFAVVLFDFDDLECFFFVTARLMVHHQVAIDEESGLPAGIDGILKLFLSAVFGPDTAFLIKFAEIIN